MKPDDQNAEGKRWKVTGICFVPAQFERIVEAETMFEAIKKAKSQDWKEHIVPNSHDECSAFDLEISTAEEINP